MCPIDMWNHWDRPMKNEQTTSNDASSSHTTWRNLDASSGIRQTRLKDVNLPSNVQFEPLIKDETAHLTITPKKDYKFNCSSMRKPILGFLIK